MTRQGPSPPQKSEAPELRVGVIAFCRVRFVSLIAPYAHTESFVIWHPEALYDVLMSGGIIGDAGNEHRGNSK